MTWSNNYPTSFVNVSAHDRVVSEVFYTPKDEPWGTMIFLVKPETHMIAGRKYKVDVDYNTFTATITEMQDE